MIRLAASICLVPEIIHGPFLYSGPLAESCRQAADAGFDAVELLVSSGESLETDLLDRILREHHLTLSGLGTGAGFIARRLHLASPDAQIRRAAVEFAEAIIDRAGQLGGFAIIGSLKGRVEAGVDPAQALAWLEEGLEQLARRAARHARPLILEPLNRYESNYINRLDEGVSLIRRLDVDNVKLLADLFHMNIEENRIASALRSAGPFVGHIHFVDSNRRPAGCGHIDFAEFAGVVREISYDGYMAAEALPWPDPESAARKTVDTFRAHVAHRSG